MYVVRYAMEKVVLYSLLVTTIPHLTIPISDYTSRYLASNGSETCFYWLEISDLRRNNTKRTSINYALKGLIAEGGKKIASVLVGTLGKFISENLV